MLVVARGDGSGGMNVIVRKINPRMGRSLRKQRSWQRKRDRKKIERKERERERQRERERGSTSSAFSIYRQLSNAAFSLAILTGSLIKRSCTCM